MTVTSRWPRGPSDSKFWVPDQGNRVVLVGNSVQSRRSRVAEIHAFWCRATAFSTSRKFFSAQLHTDLKIGWRVRPSFVTEYSTRGGMSHLGCTATSSHLSPPLPPAGEGVE